MSTGPVLNETKLDRKQSKVKPKSRYSKSETIAGYLFLTPNIIGFLCFVAIPVFISLILSFFSWDLVAPPQFVGLENFQTLLFHDPVFWRVVKNTLVYVGLYIPLNIIVSLGLALWLCSIKKNALLKTIFFLPVLAPTVAVALVWKFLYEPQGLVNFVLSILHIPAVGWLGDPDFALLGVVLMSVWKFYGLNMVIFIAGIKAIPTTLYEAAKIDGANSFHRFFKITLPMISPAMFFAIVMTLISSFQVFDQVMVMTGGGPANATNTIVMYIYETGFQYFRMGRAAAIAWLLFIVIFIVTLIQLKLQKKWVNYE
ncbi:sugar ABC transporter permease [Alkalihalobacillus oceani]|uniref:Sugar ABC transporter permease n=1 Tax=Halalkalibacter oceani TaxID=1653776 RepID=A0A9X2DPE6_9BACI|nr:sugar ABC transporter permease [Halalkalibacter oceani]MCM3712977.1 sugar ABC transporter permease [Halalkalibacter oceani]